MTRRGAAAAAAGFRPHYVTSRVGGPDQAAAAFLGPAPAQTLRGRFRPTWPAQAQSPTAPRGLGCHTAAGVTNWAPSLPPREHSLPSPQGPECGPFHPQLRLPPAGREPETPRGSSRPLLAGTGRGRRLGDNGDV